MARCSAGRYKEGGDRVSGRLKPQGHFERQQSAHAVTKEGGLTVGWGRGRHHGEYFVGQGGDAADLSQRLPIASSGVLHGNLFDITGERLGKRNIIGRGSTGVRENVKRRRGRCRVVRTPVRGPVHRASVSRSGR